jgi:hypothetical protein
MNIVKLLTIKYYKILCVLLLKHIVPMGLGNYCHRIILPIYRPFGTNNCRGFNFLCPVRDIILVENNRYNNFPVPSGTEYFSH